MEAEKETVCDLIMKRKKLSAVRRGQKAVMKGAGATSETTSKIFGKAGAQLQRLDEKLGVSVTVRKTGERVGTATKKIDGEYGLSEGAGSIGRGASALFDKGKKSADEVAENIGAYRTARKAKDAFTVYVSAPAVEFTKKYQIDKRLEAIGEACEGLYGRSRRVIKPHFSLETPDELLNHTKKQLAYISACIMQISPGEAEKLANQFGKVVVSKIAGVAATGTLLSLVSTFGTAGTGTAIAGLSGAASTSATLAWVGSLLGGGMATGAVLTGGVGIVVGLGAYKILGSERRDFDELDEIEQRIVQYCWMLIAIIDDYLANKQIQFGPEGANALLNEILLPLQSLLYKNSDRICGNLDRKNAIAFRQHVLVDFEPAIVEPFTEFVESGLAAKALHYEYVIGGVIYALLTRSAIDGGAESQLVLEALRRSDRDLADASEAELSSYLSKRDPEELKGVATNVKGIYHELLWVEQYSAEHETTRAELFETTNHAGADVRIVDVETGEVVEEFQLKATDNVGYVNEHAVRYPEISVIATDEVAVQIDGVKGSGNLNAELRITVDENFDALEDNTLEDRVQEAVGLAAAISTGQELVEMLQGKREFPEAVAEVVKKTGTAGAATAISAYLFS